MKYFRLTMREILWDYSWSNMVMLVSSIPNEKQETDFEEITGIDDLGAFLG